MTEKRFIAGDLWIQDKSSMGWTTYFLDEQKGVNELCDLINNLADENKQLTQQIEYLRKVILND